MADDAITEPLPLVPVPASLRTASVIEAAREASTPPTLQEERALRHERAMTAAAERAGSWTKEPTSQDRRRGSVPGSGPAHPGPEGGHAPGRTARSAGIVLFLLVLLAAGGTLLLLKPWAGAATAAPVAVPRVLGLSTAQAGAALRGAGLLPGGETHGFHPTVPRGQVTGTDPGAGAQVRPGSAVVLRISDGPAPTVKATALPSTTVPGIPVPTLSGRRLDEATRELSSLGLAVGTITESDSASPVGTVLSSSPGVREVLRPGALVDLTVASGLQQVPRGLLGRSVANVVQALRTAGFAVVVTDGGRSRQGVEPVTGLSATEGSRAPAGSVITVRFAPAAADPPSPTPGAQPTGSQTAGTQSPGTQATDAPSPRAPEGAPSRPDEPSTAPAG
ncbi:PASTA domain-containing protein [Arthrobacter sp. RCC_34]|uniref:PASTA domain-containing protein n=1 Tax=Arthrobacter sp. RCC_34 TaxID=3239230 RepID=UPI003524649D